MSMYFLINKKKKYLNDSILKCYNIHIKRKNFTYLYKFYRILILSCENIVLIIL